MIEYRESHVGIEPDQLGRFFAGWPDRPSAATHLRLLERSTCVLAVSGGTREVVGFITAITDGVLSAYVPLLEVLPEHRGKGIGSELVRRMLARLEHLYMIDLMCDPDMVPFYERLGFTPARGMSLRNYERQSGSGG